MIGLRVSSFNVSKVNS